MPASTQLKGKAEPQRLWRATRVLAGVGGAQRIDGLEAPLTGRDAELRTIKELFHAAADRLVPTAGAGVGPGRGGQVAAGLGVREVHRRPRGGRVVAPGPVPVLGEGVAFWALAEIVRQRLGIAEEDPIDTAAAKLAAGLDLFVSDPGEREYIGAQLRRLLGVAV